MYVCVSYVCCMCVCVYVLPFGVFFFSCVVHCENEYIKTSKAKTAGARFQM